jgi:protein involved in polysaccharide export with SLBB domain
MPANGRTQLLTVAWAVLGVCLGSLGCQTQLSYRFLEGPTTTITMGSPPLNKGDKDPAAPNPVETVAWSRPPDKGSVPAAPVAAALASATAVPSAVPGGPSADIVRVSCATGPNGEPLGGPNGNEGPIPTELAKVSMPPYVIEPPDILLLDPIRLVPRPPYRLEAFDQLVIQVSNALADQPISGVYVVSPDGVITFGYSYGSVRVVGMTIEEAEQAIRAHLSRVLNNPQVAIALREFRGIQQTRGEHLVRPDGTINLGIYGCVYVAGMTISQAKCVIEEHLSQFLYKPQIAVDVLAYNSKVYYLIYDGGGYGQQVFRFPITGNETVLDAVGNVAGLPAVSSKKRIWVARPSPADWGCDQVLPVDWRAITEGGSTATNYQLFPGDRIYVKADALVALDNALAKIFSPIERIFGITLLGSSTVQSFRNNNNRNNGNTGFLVGF